MRRDFGSQFPEVVFENDTTTIRQEVSYYVERAVNQEPRATLERVEVQGTGRRSLKVIVTFYIDEEGEDAIERGFVVQHGKNVEMGQQ